MPTPAPAPDLYLSAQQAIARAVCSAAGLPEAAFDPSTQELALPNSPVHIWFGFVDPEIAHGTLKAKALCAEVRLECPLTEVSNLEGLVRFGTLASRLGTRAAATTARCCFQVERGQVTLTHPTHIQYCFGVTSAGLGDTPVTQANAPSFAVSLVQAFQAVLADYPWQPTQPAPETALTGSLPQA